MHENVKLNLAVLGMGYVGLPLAVEFAKKFNVVGFDVNIDRIKELKAGKDSTCSVAELELREVNGLSLTNKLESLQECNVYIVAVPTPIDISNQPDLSALVEASKNVGNLITQGDTVIFESTVYPGTTEEVCVEILETESGLKLNNDFFVGYSPERINPGDHLRPLKSIVKVTSGSSEVAASFVDKLYSSIITAGTHRAPSIKVAEAAKIIENTQRDVNIALMNEFSLIFKQLNIDTIDVLNAAGTKWNFLPFRPGLVGGHCISVDPYYLTYKSELHGYHPEIILAARRINNIMGKEVAKQTIKLMIKKGVNVSTSRVLILGFTFKENCPDTRNTKVIDIISEIQDFDVLVDVFDPIADVSEFDHGKEINFISKPENHCYDAVILAVGHDAFIECGPIGIRNYLLPNGSLIDVKSLFPHEDSDWRL